LKNKGELGRSALARYTTCVVVATRAVTGTRARGRKKKKKRITKKVRSRRSRNTAAAAARRARRRRSPRASPRAARAPRSAFGACLADEQEATLSDSSALVRARTPRLLRPEGWQRAQYARWVYCAGKV